MINGELFFDENEINRGNNGSKGAHVFHNADNPNEIVVLFEWYNLDNARKFFESSKLSKEFKTPESLLNQKSILWKE